MTPFDAIGNFVIGWIRTGRLERLAKLAASVAATAFVSFWGTLGTSIWALFESGFVWPWVLILAFANASIAMAAAVLFLWRKSPLSKGLPIAVPGDIQVELDKILQEKSMVMSGDPKKS